MEEELCPSEPSVPCGSIENVEEFCKMLLGETIVSEISGTSETGANALEGCKTFVSYDRGSCCHSNYCYLQHDDDHYEV